MLLACAAAASALAALAGWPAAARAHDPFEITTTARVRADAVDVHVTMARGTAARACGQLAWEACGRGLYRISAGGQALAPREARAQVTEENDVEIALAYPPPTAGPLRFEALFLGKLRDPGYGATLTVTGERTFLGQELLRADAPAFEVPLAPPGAGGAAPPARVPGFGAYLGLGVRHIVFGYDHLLFLAGLLVVCRTLRSVLLLVTCFTAAHSVTLALAALGLVTVSGRVVEPLIAATIVFVGVENLARRGEPRYRRALAFAFGLVHGLGFAGALRQTGLGGPGASLAGPLIAFNLGVELGQLAVAAPLVAVWWRLRRNPVVARRGVQALSVLVAGAGLYWLAVRLS